MKTQSNGIIPECHDPIRPMIYLDYGSTSFPKPDEVYLQMDQFYRNAGVNPGRGDSAMCRRASGLVQETRALLASFFNGRDPDRLIFTQNATDALNLAIFGIVRPGDHVITTVLEHNAVLRPLHHLQQEAGVAVDRLPLGSDGRVDPDDFRRRFRKKTRLVVINHVSNVTGVIQPVAEIGKICREQGVPLLVDASQSAGKIPIDVQADAIDLLAFTGHKCLYGPMGIGGLYVGDGVHVRHRRAGGTGIRSEVPGHLEEYPYRLEYGTPNLPGIAGLNAGIKWIRSQGIPALNRHDRAMSKKLREGLSDIEGVSLYGITDPAFQAGVISLRINDLAPGSVESRLDREFAIACRAGLHCAPLVHKALGTLKLGGTVRLSPGFFTTDAQVEAAISAVDHIARTAFNHRPDPASICSKEPPRKIEHLFGGES